MERKGNRHVVSLLTLLAAFVLSGILVLVGLDSGRARADSRGAPAAAGVDAVLAQPRSYLFKQATVRGTVLRIVGQRILALRSHSVRQGLLIVLAEGTVAEAGLREGQTVEVGGRVRPVCRGEVQALRHDLAADVNGENLLAFYGGDPYILAEVIRKADAPQ